MFNKNKVIATAAGTTQDVNWCTLLVTQSRTQ